MKIMDRLSRILGSHAKPTNQPQSQFLDPVEIRLIAEGKLERLADFAATSRLHSRRRSASECDRFQLIGLFLDGNL